jgi:hypothetical protein
MVGLSGLEPPALRLSGVRSNQLSYRPIATMRGILLEMNCTKVKRYMVFCWVASFLLFLYPPLLHHLPCTANGEGVFADIIRNDTARCDSDMVSHGDGSHQGCI